MKNRKFGPTAAQSIDADLGVQRRTGPTAMSPINGNEVERTVADAQRRATSLMNQPGPDGLIGQIFDQIMPSATRKERGRVDQEILRAEGNAIVKAHEITKGVIVHQLSVAAEVFGKQIELQAAKEVGSRALEVADDLDAQIARRGEVFDEGIDRAVDQARTRTSLTARTGAANRIELRLSLRQQVEQALADRVVDIVQRTNSTGDE